MSTNFPLKRPINPLKCPAPVCSYVALPGKITQNPSTYNVLYYINLFYLQVYMFQTIRVFRPYAYELDRTVFMGFFFNTNIIS